ncbi:hypothetical protein N5C65_02150 [Pseudomonas aeruginosa]|uniref:hypothetical protein n=1 Tax=Pseudomonas aeruginosa TaxID=287 RepID=UPI00053EAB8D|nr:hypothetical protein [Pseudomonas aeruginosa]KKJ41661.1 hypothetical protein T648_24055 [Pseudomonas aeruginosa MRSN 317]MCZ0964745.1 hypothetical protein [Pseudomonas aeruginosa]MDH0902462.1 hypothetical protein [Pseudomonas aeruginosa]MDH1214740.1 hypothetical protein [Pseudomonas aeruginosa]MDH1224606.1 hypothetical protein [Pseudomonas aeruginosa]
MNWLKGTVAAVGLMVSCTAVADSAAQIELMNNLHQRMLDALQALSVDQVTEVFGDLDRYRPGIRRSASDVCLAAYEALGWVLSDLVVQADMDEPLPELQGHKKDYDQKRLACAADA